MGTAPTIAVYLSSHGFGHCRRTAAVLTELARRQDVRLDVMGSAPQTLWPRELGDCTIGWRARACDVGVVQPDDLSVDHAATQLELRRWSRGYDRLVEREARRLRGRVAIVLGDVPPLAFDAAELAGVPALALANFSWDWIYKEMGLDDAADRAAESYAKAAALIELTPFAPMDAFGHRVSVGVVGTASRLGREASRLALGVRGAERLVLIALRTGPAELVRLPAPEDELRYLWPAGGCARADVIVAGEELEFSDLLAAADAVVAKPGYGIIGDAAVAGTPMLYVEREGFPEDTFLVRWLEGVDGAARVESEALAEGSWLDGLERLLEAGRVEASGRAGVEAAADVLVRALMSA